MGTEIVRVPPGFVHPGEDVGDPIPGAHLEPLYEIGEAACTHWRLYENVSEGSPISPTFASREELFDWLRSNGASDDNLEMLASWGHAPSLVVRA